MIEAKHSLKNVTPYVPGRPISEIQRLYGLKKVVKLASNENPLGASPRAKEAVRRAADSLALYPDPGAHALRMALSEKLGVPPEALIFGTGSDGLIELVCKTFLAAGEESLMPDPSFSLYELNVRAAGAVPVKLRLNADYRFSPLDFLPRLTPKTRVVWLCNPNNPTGCIYTQEEQLKFLDALPRSVLVVIDEAYYEYAAQEPAFPDSLAQLQSHENVLILRTFSKIYGLAGLRVGYGIAAPELIGQLEKTRPPFNVCAPAQAAALESLKDGEFVRKTLAVNEENKRFLKREFSRLGLSFLPSYTNFIAVNLRRDAKDVTDRLLRRGYIVKGGHVLNLPEYLRVTVGTREECEGFIQALARVLEEV